MPRFVIALLLNALVLPGFGQLYLGRKGVGIALVVAVNLLLLPALFLMMKILSPILGAHLVGSPLSAPQMLAAAQPYAGWGKLLLTAFLAIWGYGLIDLLLTGRSLSDTP